MKMTPTRKLPHVEALIYGHPWAIEERALDVIAEIVENKLLGGETDWERDPKAESDSKVTMQGGVAVVPITGTILKKATMFDRISGATSTGQIQARLKEAMAMEDAKAIMLKFDSPGGEVTGIAETGDAIFAARSKTPKPIIAFSENRMTSAAYWLGAQTDRVITTPDAITGSIGVIIKLLDMSRMERNVGVDSHVLRSGPNKAAGVGPITDEQLRVFRELRDEAFAAFTQAVERGRNMKLSDEVLTGRIYSGAAAIGAGLVDENMTFEETIREFGS